VISDGRCSRVSEPIAHYAGDRGCSNTCTHSINADENLSAQPVGYQTDIRNLYSLITIYQPSESGIKRIYGIYTH